MRRLLSNKGEQCWDRAAVAKSWMSLCDIFRWNQQHWGLDVSGVGAVASGDLRDSDISSRVDGGHTPSG